MVAEEYEIKDIVNKGKKDIQNKSCGSWIERETLLSLELTGVTVAKRRANDRLF